MKFSTKLVELDENQPKLTKSNQIENLDKRLKNKK